MAGYLACHSQSFKQFPPDFSGSRLWEVKPGLAGEHCYYYIYIHTLSWINRNGNYLTCSHFFVFFFFQPGGLTGLQACLLEAWLGEDRGGVFNWLEDDGHTPTKILLSLWCVCVVWCGGSEALFIRMYEARRVCFPLAPISVSSEIASAVGF